MARTPAFERFLASMVMDYEKWHDGIGMDLDAIAEMTDAERNEAALIVKRRRPITWREIEALVILDPLAAERLAGHAQDTKRKKAGEDEIDAADDDEESDEDFDGEDVDEEEDEEANEDEDGEDTNQEEDRARRKLVPPREPRSPTPRVRVEQPIRSPAYQRFNRHMEAHLFNWPEGEGYDLAALAEMNDAERREIAQLLATRGEVTWREVEVLAAIDAPETRGEIDKALAHHQSIDTRLAAAVALHRLQRLPDLDSFLARQIRQVTNMTNGGPRALALAEQHPSQQIKQALLWASWNQTEFAPHAAALLCFLCRKAQEKFDENLRPMLARLDVHNSYFDRKKAFEELTKLVGMELDTSQE